MLHGDLDKPVVIGNQVTVGHSAVVHGCRIEDGCLIGIGAVVLNGARIGEGSVVAADIARARERRSSAAEHGSGRSRQGEAAGHRRGDGPFSEQLRALRPAGTNVQGRTAVIHAVKGTRDILPPSSDLWNAVEQRAPGSLSRFQLPRDPHADLRGDTSVRARCGRGNRHRHQGDVHLRGPGRRLPHAAA